uniref:allergen Bos d 2-like n=1 Tax=Jaculus jaculus TaxID=51337 RepID=UPI001E1AF99F|nr:allergen Bos d 2-like [Jaculus jaculus]
MSDHNGSGEGIYKFSKCAFSSEDSTGFHTVYIAADKLATVEENGPMRISARQIVFSHNSDKVTFMFYIRKRLHGICQPSNTSQCEEYRIAQTSGLNLAFLGLSDVQIKTLKPGVRGFVKFSLKFVSKNTILSEATHEDEKGTITYLTIAFAKGTSLSKEMYDKYLKMTNTRLIPKENIQELIKSDGSNLEMIVTAS